MAAHPPQAAGAERTVVDAVDSQRSPGVGRRRGNDRRRRVRGGARMGTAAGIAGGTDSGGGDAKRAVGRSHAPHPADVGSGPSRSIGTAAHRHHEHTRSERYRDRAGVGGRSADDEPALPAGCDRCGRAIGGHRARRSRAKPHRDRAQPVAHQRGRSGTDSATHRCGGAALQGPGARRRTASARRGADTTNQLTTMDIKRMFATTLLLSGVFAVNATAAIDAGVLRRSVLDTRERSACGPSESARGSLEPLRGAHAPSNSGGGGAPTAMEKGGAPRELENDDQADDLLERARDLMEEGRFERAIESLNRVIEMKASTRTDAALYWKAYSLAKLGQQADALKTVTDLYEKFGNSRWLKEAKALEVEIRQASGQPVRPESQNDDDLKLYALRGLMNSDPDQALPIIEKILSGTDSPKVKERALFVLSQSHSPRARHHRQRSQGKRESRSAAEGDPLPRHHGRTGKSSGAGRGLRLVERPGREAVHSAKLRNRRRPRAAALDRERGNRSRSAGRSGTSARHRARGRRIVAAVSDRIVRRGEEADPPGDVHRRRRRQVDRAREGRARSGTSQDGDPQPRADEARGNDGSADVDLRVGYVARREEGGHQRAVPAAERNRARHPGACREKHRIEEGDRPEALGDEIEGSD